MEKLIISIKIASMLVAALLVSGCFAAGFGGAIATEHLRQIDEVAVYDPAGNAH